MYRFLQYHINIYLLLVIVFFSTDINAQVTVPAANTNTGNVNDPFGSYFGYERTAMIYTSAQIGTTGSITAVGFYVNSVSTPGTATNVRIYMKQRTTLMTANTTYATETTGATLVFGPTDITGFTAGSWKTITLATPFTYTGGTNHLEVIVETNATGGGNEGVDAKQFRYSPASGTSTQYYQAWNQDNTAPTGNGTRSANRPNIQLAFAGSCNMPTVNSTTSITSTSATLNWTAASPAPSSGYEWEVRTSGAAGSGATGLAASGSTVAGVVTANATGLTANTTYSIYVRSNCGGSGFSAWTSAVTFSTPCASLSLNVTQGFNATTIPSCWTQQNVTGASAIQFVASSSNPTTTPQEGADYVYWNSYNITSLNQTRLVSPPITTTGTANVTTEFYWMHDAGYSTYTSEGVQVQYSTDGTTWINAGSLITRYHATLTGWNFKSVNLPAGAGNQATVYVGFLFTSQYGNNCAMDNVVIKPTPTAPTVTSFTPSSACASAGATVLITGTNFTGATAVTIGGTAVAFTVNSATQITATIGAGTTGTIAVTTAGGTGTSAGTFTVNSTPSVPTASAATNLAATSFSANWATAAGATAYQLDVSTDNTFASFVSGFNGLNVGNVLTYSVTGLSANTPYYYRVRAINAGGCASANSATIAPIAYQAQFISMSTGSSTWCSGETRTISVTVKNTGRFSWTNSGPEINVGVKWNTNGANWADYYIRTDAGGVAPGATATFNLDLTASNSTASNTYGSPLAAGTNNIIFDLVKEGDCWFGNNNGSCGPGNSVLTSSAITITTTPAPTANIATNLATNSFSANWGTISGATSYILDVSTNNTFSSFVTGYNGLNVGTVLTYSVTGLSASTTYYYRVRAIGACGTSASSSTITAVTACSASIVTTATSINETFNTTSTTLSCWALQTITGTAVATATTGTNPATSPQEGNQMIYYNSYNIAAGGSSRLISMPLNTSGATGIDVDFYWRNENNASYSTGAYLNEGVQVQYSTDGGTTWTNMGAFIPRHDGSLGTSVAQWNFKSVLGGTGIAVGTNVRIGFLFTSQYGDNCFLDNVTIRQTCVQGNPSVFGSNTWNVYAYNAGDATGGSGAWTNNYSGYYTISSLNFDTQTGRTNSTAQSWGNTLSPSSASGYLGCAVGVDNHSYVFKRQGVGAGVCGTFRIDALEHDDMGILKINGIEVWRHANGCCDIHTGVWSGYLDANSQIEYYISEGSGGSNAALVFTQITTSATITGVNPTICGGNGTVTVSSPVGGYANIISSGFGSAPSGTTVYGSASITGEECVLTSASASLLGNWGIVPAIRPDAWEITYQQYIGGGSGADGMSFSYGGFTPSAGNGGEAGFGTGLSISFDTYTSATNSQLWIYYDGAVVASSTVNVVNLRTATYVPVTITVNNSNQVTVVWNGTTIFSNVALPAGYASANKSAWNYAFSARTGGATDIHKVDNVNLYAINYFDYSINGTTWQTSNVFAVPAGSYTVQARHRIGTSCITSSLGSATLSNPALPTITLGTVASVCSGATSISLPYSATTNSPNQYSITTGTPAMASFTSLTNAAITASPLNITIPASATANTYQFNLTVTNSITACTSTNQTFNVTVANVPSITTISPSAATFCPGGSASNFSATGSGGTGTGGAYQWQYSTGGAYTNFVNGSGSAPYFNTAGNPNSSTVAITPYSSAGTGFAIKCIYTTTGTGCTVSSSSVSIGYNTLSSDPTGITSSAFDICNGGTVNMSVNGGSLGTGASWKWYSASCGGTFVGTGASISPAPSTTTTYFVRAEGTCNTTACVNYGVNVFAQPSISTVTSPPNPICPGGNATVSVAASGGGGSIPITYQWQYNNGGTWGNVVAATPTGMGYTNNTTTSMGVSTTNASTPAGAFQYRCIVSSAGTGCNAATSTAATVTVNAEASAPSASMSPATTPVCVGATLTLASPALGTGGSGTQAFEYSTTSSSAGFSTTVPNVSAASVGSYNIWIRTNPTGQGCNLSPATQYTWSAVADATISTSVPNLCSGATVAIASTVNGGAGSGTYQWQESASGSGTTFANVSGGSGATSATYTTPALTAPKFYQVIYAPTTAGCDVVSSPPVALDIAPSAALSTAVTNVLCNGNATGAIDLSVTNMALTIDGNITEGAWGQAIATSAGGPVNGFAAGHEANAIYAINTTSDLYLAIAGNVQTGNRILTFIDSKAGGYTTGNFGRTSAPQGIDDFNSGTTFDNGFAPDYALVIGTDGSGNYFWDLYTLSGTAGSGGGPTTYLGDNSSADLHGNPANGSNTSGFEMKIAKSALGNPSSAIGLMTMYISEGGYLNNQFLTRAGSAQGAFTGGAINFNNEPPNPIWVTPHTNAPLSYAWSNGATTEDIAGLTANTYTITVTTANGCIATANPIVTQPTALVSALSDKSDDLCQLNAGQVKLTVSGGVPSYNITWTPTHGSPTSPQTISNDGGFLVVDGLHGNTTYHFIVTDNNGCHVP